MASGTEKGLTFPGWDRQFLASIQDFQVQAANSHLVAAAILLSCDPSSQYDGFLTSTNQVVEMSAPFASAKVTLSCPIYAADFDPGNNGFLLVGGGGGEGRSGVGNKIVRHSECYE